MCKWLKYKRELCLSTPLSCISLSHTSLIQRGWGSQVAQHSKALHFSARGIPTDPDSFPGCITTGRDWESHRAAHNWPSVVWVRVWPPL